MVSWGINFPHKRGPIPFWLAPPFDNFKISPTYMLFQFLYQNYNKTKYSFPLLLDLPGKPDNIAIHHLNHCVWYLFDSKVTRSVGLSQDPSVSEYGTLTHFFMSLAGKYVNLKEPNNEGITELVTTKLFLKKKRDFTWNPQLLSQSVQKVFFKFSPKFSPLFVILTFQIIYQ